MKNTKKEKFQKGEYKIEFYTNLEEILKRYKAGIVVIKILYEEFYNNKKITMQYHRFAYFLRKELLKMNTKNDNKIINEAKEIKHQKEDNEPIILSVGGKKSTFNPHTRDINTEDILGGK